MKLPGTLYQISNLKFQFVQLHANSPVRRGTERSIYISLSLSDCTAQPRTRLSKPHVNKLMWVVTLSSAQATHDTIRLWPWPPCLLERGSRASRWPFMSNSLTCLLSWGMAMTPLAETDKRLMAESALIVATGDRMLRRSQTLTVRSSEPDTTLSSLLNTADVTLLQKQRAFCRNDYIKFKRIPPQIPCCTL